MIFKGKTHKYGDNVNTDEIIPARYLNTADPAELAKHCMEDIDGDFVKNVSVGDIIVGGKNFGCGSSRELNLSSSRRTFTGSSSCPENWKSVAYPRRTASDP